MPLKFVKKIEYVHISETDFEPFSKNLHNIYKTSIFEFGKLGYTKIRFCMRFSILNNLQKVHFLSFYLFGFIVNPIDKILESTLFFV